MARRKRTNDQPIGVGMTAKQMKRKNQLTLIFFLTLNPLQIIKRNFLMLMVRVKM